MELPKIYLKEPNLTDLKSLINNGYSANGYFVRTFNDETCISVQCRGGARRSFEDLLAISKTYFPKTTEVDLMKVLKQINIKFYFCSSVKKIVFHYLGIFNLEKNGFDQYLKLENAKRILYSENTYTLKQLSNIYEQL